MNQQTLLMELIDKVAAERSPVLDFSQGGLRQIPHELFQLIFLRELNLEFNALVELSPWIEQLANLTSLNLRDNELHALPDEIGELKNLTTLNLRGNRLKELPLSMQKLYRLKRLDLRNNPELDIPQEVLEQTNDPEFILDAYFSAQRKPLNEAKLLLVGQGGVGKTAITRRLIEKLPPSDKQGKTEGVEIKQMNVDVPISIGDEVQTNTIRLNIWDFGGQGIYQATHQIFFTSRSLYLVVIDARTGEQESRLQHWLKLVGSLSNNAPSIVVVNKQDVHPLDLNERELRFKYPNLEHVVYTSCTENMGFDILEEKIIEVLTNMPFVRDQFPISWFALKERLEKMSDNYITYEQYTTYCYEAGIKDSHDQENWVNILHQLGVVLSFHDDRRLEGTHVLNPNWVTDGVYRVLSDSQLAHNKGVLTEDLLDSILNHKSYPRHKQYFIVGMMQRFELCFPIIGSKNNFLVPDLLSNRMSVNIETEFFQDKLCLKFEYHYLDFLPSSILSRFIVRMMAHIDQDLSWRNGAVLRFNENRALVYADLEARKIFISVNGLEATRRSLLNSIRMQLQEIHMTFANLPYSEEVPLMEFSGRTIPYKALYNYSKRGMETYYDGVLDIDIDVERLLNGIESPTMRKERQIQVKLIEEYNLDELKQFCFDLGIDYDDLPTTKKSMARELVLYMSRTGRLEDLEKNLR